ncbi:DNA polymerase III subunit delta, partial [Candidatus Pelagibacter sp.]|nr:DNA polymerase III subunit delta [Candidatus Pelagibacter sp.]
RTFLNKSKKILLLTKEYELEKNIDRVLSSAKPPIFWKDKEITKQQIYKWSPDSLRTLIYKLNELEFLVKKNINNSIYLITDFILSQVSTKT